jgi:thiamine biosynthesis protein ThiS
VFLRIQVNGESREVHANSSLQDLIVGLELKAERLAIELNDKVVRRADWEITVLRGDDKIEIVHFVGGGCS